MPLILPSAPEPSFVRELTPADYATLSHEWSDGVSHLIPAQFTGAGTTLKLEYNQVKQLGLVVLTNFHKSALGENVAFLLPSNFTKYPAVVVAGLEGLLSTTWWVFEGEVAFKTEVADAMRGLYTLEFGIRSVVS